jgi:hypothetical protein
MTHWQLPIVVLIVVAAVAYLARRTWRNLTGRKAGGCGGCSCAKPPSLAETKGSLIPADQITLRLRKGASRPTGG